MKEELPEEHGIYSHQDNMKLNMGCLVAVGVFIALLIWAIFLTKQIW